MLVKRRRIHRIYSFDVWAHHPIYFTQPKPPPVSFTHQLFTPQCSHSTSGVVTLSSCDTWTRNKFAVASLSCRNEEIIQRDDSIVASAAWENSDTDTTAKN